MTLPALDIVENHGRRFTGSPGLAKTGLALRRFAGSPSLGLWGIFGLARASLGLCPGRGLGFVQGCEHLLLFIFIQRPELFDVALGMDPGGLSTLEVRQQLGRKLAIEKARLEVEARRRAQQRDVEEKCLGFEVVEDNTGSITDLQICRRLWFLVVAQ